MLTKISSMLDAVADRLQKKGMMEEARDIDRIADLVDQASSPAAVAKAIEEALAIVKQKHPDGMVTASALGKSIATALLMGLGAMAKAGQPVDTTEMGSALNKASDSLATIQPSTDLLPAPKMGNISGLKVRMTTKAQEAAYNTINALDKEMGQKGMRTTERQQILRHLLIGMGMLI